MRARSEILRDLVGFVCPLASIQAELAAYPWDSAVTLITMDANDLVGILRRYLKGEISPGEVEDWANAVEMREDIECSDELVKDVVFDLANPTLQGSLSHETARSSIELLSATIRARDQRELE
jgi:hypothetical protein